jgi:GAF domain-containing protein
MQRGFRQDFLDHFATVRDDGAACGRAMNQRERVVIENVETDPEFAPHRRIGASAGYRAVQSTPLFNRRGQPLGMVPTHFRQPHRPSERKLHDDFSQGLAVLGMEMAKLASRPPPYS